MGAGAGLFLVFLVDFLGWADFWAGLAADRAAVFFLATFFLAVLVSLDVDLAAFVVFFTALAFFVFLAFVFGVSFSFLATVSPFKSAN